VWFATQDGISRFDGKSFINLNSYLIDPRRKILGTDVYDIKPDQSGDYLWVLSAYGGLNKVDLKTCNVTASYQVTHLVKPNVTLWYKCFYETTKFLIIGTNEGIVSLFNKATGKTEYSFSLADKFNCDGPLEDIFVDGKNRTWFLVSGKGILITDELCKSKISFISSSKIHNSPFVFTDYAFFNNSIFITTSAGLFLIDAEKMGILNAENNHHNSTDFSGKELHSISIADSLAIISGKNLLIKINLLSGETENIQLAGNFEDRSWLTLTSAVLLNGQTIWVGSQAGIGWIRDINSPFSPFYNSFDGQNIKIHHAITIKAITDSTVLVCSIDGLYLVNHKTSVIKRFPVIDVYYSVFPAPNGYFIASGESKGLQLLDRNLNPLSITTLFPELGPIKNDY
jgi:ligand-binding sensor domain-containing protein